MSVERAVDVDTRVQHTVTELQDLIRGRYPTASFKVARGEDPVGTYVTTTVDIDDPDEVLDLIMDRLLDIQIEEGLPVYVIPVRTEERVLQDLRSRKTLRYGRALPD